MTSFFRAIEDLFVNYLFGLHDFLRGMENWWGANTINWIFMVICASAFVYWMLQLRKYDKNGEEKKDASAHSYI